MINDSAARPFDVLEKLAPFEESIEWDMYFHTPDAKLTTVMIYGVKDSSFWKHCCTMQV
jgi:hypothetical protein